jgi:hypothetical protein
MDGLSFEAIKADIRDAVDKYLPNLIINEISITPYLEDLEAQGEINMDNLGVGGIYRVPGRGTEEYTAKVRIDYTITDSTFESKDFIIINI